MSQPPIKPHGAPPVALDWDAFMAVIATLSVNGLKRKACELNGWTYNQVWGRICREHEAGNTQWLEAWDGALDDYRESLKAEAHRRAVEGVERPVFGSMGQGLGTGVVGHVTEYSDTLLLAKLKAHVPEYRPTLDVNATVQHTAGGQRPDLFAGLSMEAKKRIRAIIVEDLAAQRKARATEVEVVAQTALPGPESGASA